MEGVLKRALESGRPIESIYEAKDGRLSQRTVTVHRMNKKEVLVWCHAQHGFRSLKISYRQDQ
ncbi:hypothetical protein [Alteribacillus bidgolensis]|uniref:WYL domain-containing protein n=1 Tax=Alteribacillus bidgolensis TaxID=930129 RepID=A0A1G8E3Z9_9BACI|nr:hypothetical protein [Alteribacillus bidgolensis]SDH64604.1 hypothetical protein SAMN05216352_10261 [Alteribacillus bidgolensis]